MSNRKSTAVILTAGASLLASHPLLHAAEPGAAESLTEVVVMARKLGAGSARATFVIEAADIEQRPLGADITQSLARAPGVQVSTGDSRGGSSGSMLSSP